MTGGVELHRSRGVRVEAIGAGVMGGFGASAGDTMASDRRAGVLRVTGLAIMGGVDVKVREPSKRILRRLRPRWTPFAD